MALAIPGSATPTGYNTGISGRARIDTGFSPYGNAGYRQDTGDPYTMVGGVPNTNRDSPGTFGTSTRQSTAPTQQGTRITGAVAPGAGGLDAGGAVPPTTPTMGGPEASAMMSLDASTEFPQPMQTSEGNILRQLGRRIYPQESMALASMGRVY